MSGNKQTQGQQAGGKSSMTKDDSSRVQSSQAKGGNNTGQGSFASRAQAAGDKNDGGKAGGNDGGKAGGNGAKK